MLKPLWLQSVGVQNQSGKLDLWPQNGSRWSFSAENLPVVTETPPTFATPPPASASMEIRLVCHLLVVCPYCISTLLLMSFYCQKVKGTTLFWFVSPFPVIILYLSLPPGCDLSVSMAVTHPTEADQGLEDDYDVITEHHFWTEEIMPSLSAPVCSYSYQDDVKVFTHSIQSDFNLFWFIYRFKFTFFPLFLKKLS